MVPEFKSNLVSVIIPTYNRATLLKEALASVHAQTYRPIECIIVDDGSTDDTPAAIKEFEQFQAFDFQVLYLKQAKSGAQVARNTGTTASRGEFVQYLDSDDILYPDKLTFQVDYLTQHRECDGVFGDWRSGLPSDSKMIKGFASKDLVGQFLADRCIPNFSFLMRMKIISRIGEWDPTIRRNQEIDFHIRGLLAGGNFHYQEISTGLWRCHLDERIANTTNLHDVLFFYRKMERLLIEKNLFTIELRSRIAAQHIWFLSTYKSSPVDELVAVMKETVRLKPDIGFNQSRKLRLLQLIAGKNIAFRIWVNRFRKTTKEVETCQP